MVRSLTTPLSTRLLVLTLLSLSAACGRLGVELLPVQDGVNGRNDAGGPGLDGGVEGGAWSPDATLGGEPVDPGQTDTCTAGTCASEVDRCPDSPRDWGGVCGCDASDADSDGDGTPDCVDLCPGMPDRLAGGVCGCAAAMGDSDGDGVANCNDLCANDPSKTLPGICGCNLSDADADDDEMPDCADACPSDENKVLAGSCGCGMPETDGDGDGTPDCVDTCNLGDEASYQPDQDCGVGYCQDTNTPSSCVNGLETACQPNDPLSSTDATCDGVDDDCDGAIDEEYTVVAQCGLGHCRTTSTPSSCSEGEETVCRPGAPLRASDTTCDGIDDDCSGTADEDYVRINTCGQGYCRTNNTPSSCSNGVETACRPAMRLSNNDATADGVDDDCDGQIDEDACVARTVTYSVGAHTVPTGPCSRVTVRLWGGGGAAGDAQGGYWGSTRAGLGGPGGFAEGTFTGVANTNLQLYIGLGGRNCGGAGSNANTAFNGGAGSTSRGGNGTRGADGSVTGGTGANPSGGGSGGNGSFGGGGGGSGSGPLYAPFGSGGGGGAASVLVVNSTRMVAGGGGGGGGAGTDITTAGHSGGAGGSGCSINGSNGPSGPGGGGGGGGVCTGANITQRGTGRMPYNPSGSQLPANAATGGDSANDCSPGGDGFATITFAP